jgi:hypothetical protein
LISDVYNAGEPLDIHRGHPVTNSTDYLYFPDLPPVFDELSDIQGSRIVANSSEYLYFPNRPLIQIDFDTHHGAHDTRGNGSGLSLDDF